MDALDLNVGGFIYTTSMNTLTKHPDSVLYKIATETMPSGRDRNSSYFLSFYFKDKFHKLKIKNKFIFKDRLFIDRNGHFFYFILQYLRTNKLNLQHLNKEQLGFIKEEAKFFNITQLMLYLENECK